MKDRRIVKTLSDRGGKPVSAAIENNEPAVPWRIPLSYEKEPATVEHALRERIKELNCLYAIMQLAEQFPDSLEDFLAAVAGVLPPSWQYPRITCARIVFRKQSYSTRGFKVSRWRQTADIRVFGEPVGKVEVYYKKEMPPSHEGPFLREERALIDAVAERIGTLATRMKAEQELKEINRQLLVERQSLQETNTTLRTVLGRIEEEKREIRKDIQANIEKVVLPILNELAIKVPRLHRKYIDLLRDNLEDISSSFSNEISQKYSSLTPTEIRICKMIRDGMRTKEIAQIRGVSAATISRHREHIRRKLAIANEAVNLTTYLQTTM